MQCTSQAAFPTACAAWLVSPRLQVDEEVRVLAAEGLRPADLIQELLLLR